MDSEKSSQTLLYAAILGLMVAGFFLYRGFFGGEVEQSTTRELVCVETGKLFEIDRDDIIALPTNNPDTGRATLYPYEKRDGMFFVQPHYRASLEAEENKEFTQHVDMETLQVILSP